MNHAQLRSSFTLFFVDSQPERSEGAAAALAQAGYNVARFRELTECFSELVTNPPHMIFLHAEEKGFDLKAALSEFLQQLPETHIFMLYAAGQREAALAWLTAGAYDLVPAVTAHSHEWVKAADRAMERDYYMYMNEQLLEKTQATESVPAAAPASVDLAEQIRQEMIDEMGSQTTGVVLEGETTFRNRPAPLQKLTLPVAHREIDLLPAEDAGSQTAITQEFTQWARGLFQKRTLDECVESFMSELAGLRGNVGAVYFKYVANRRSLVAALSVNLPNRDLRGIGLNLNEEVPDFKTHQLREAHKIPAVAEMLKEVFGAEQFVAWAVEMMGEIMGICCFFCDEFAAEQAPLLEMHMMLLNRSGSLLEMEKRLHAASQRDAATDILNRHNFLLRLTEEVARSRRTSLPTSLLVISLDQYGDIIANVGREEADTILRMIAKIFERNGRVNDILGRVGSDEFGLLLPHTPMDGAMIKAERLRRIIESADFSKVLKSYPNLTISLGLSEYPSVCHDADELLQMADEALYQVRSQHNRICVAKASDGFVADFVIRENQN